MKERRFTVTMMMRLDALRSTIRTVLIDSLAEHGINCVPEKSAFLLGGDSLFERRIVLPMDVPSLNPGAVCTGNLYVHCSPFEEYCRRISRPAQPRTLALCQNIGQLMPANRWRHWEFTDDRIDQRVARQMADAIIRYGIPWIDRIKTLDDFYQHLLRRRTSSWHQLGLFERFLSQYTKGTRTKEASPANQEVAV